MENIFSLQDKVILITGGSGYLGSAMSEAFVQYGARVYLASRNVKKNEQFAKQLVAKYNRDVFGISMDVRNQASVQKAIKQIIANEKRIDVLVNNAYGGKTGDMLTSTESDWSESFDSSVYATFRVTRETLPFMIKQRQGSIINIASMYGVVSPNPEIYGTSGQNNPPFYGAAKAGIIQLTKYLACHYGKDGVRANCISPGPFPNLDTKMNKDFIENLSRKTPMNRVGQPAELQGIAVLLASDASSYINGQNIGVDGGWTVW